MIKREAIYKRELNHSYMVLRCSGTELTERYDYRILMHNRIRRLLPCSMRQMDGEDFLYYDISSKQPLERLYEGGMLKASDLADIIREIAAVQADLGEYMLDESGLLLEEGMIFADVETKELHFAFYPGNKEAVRQYEGLADFFLGNTDHSQEQAVDLAYEFYRMSKTDYFVLSSFLPLLEKKLVSVKTGWEEESLAEMERLEGAALKADFGDSQDREEKEETGEKERKKAKKEGVFQRLLSFLKREKGASAETDISEEWSDMVWDSYEQQLYENGSQETVYFADLDKKERQIQKALCLRAEEGNRKILLRDFPITFGKMKGRVTVVLEDHSVSRIHAQIEAAEDGMRIRDLNSRNGTCINGKKLLPNEAEPLQEGDTVSFGRERFRCERA
ncbi:MAG: FHA domain-containing protein [Firmicutes bacterium]|nr:FHA domain-containing protein [Bacillota bacterium]